MNRFSMGEGAIGRLAIVLSMCWLALAWPVAAVRAEAVPDSTLGATLLPAVGDAGGSQLGVNWRGEAGASLTITWQRPAGADRVLLAGRELDVGANLFSLPLPPQAEGGLVMQAHTAAGVVVKTVDLATLRGQTDFAWESVFAGPGLDAGASVSMGGATATVVWDDGDGPALYVGGSFVTAGARQANRIARWDGEQWSPLTGPLGTGIGMDGSGNPSVKALTVFEGDLIVGGFFDNAGGVTVSNIARWDGEQWSALGAGLSGSIGVNALTVFEGGLIAGGTFTTSGAGTVNRIARWDGGQWLPLGSGIGEAGSGQTPAVYALAEFAGELVVGGNFINAGGVPVGRIARWNGSAWAGLGAGVSEAAVPSATLPSVNALLVMAGDLIVGGNFRQAGGAPAGAVARWNGSAWSALGAGMTGEGNVRVHALAAFAGDLFAGGSFASADGTAVNHVARWNGSQWSALSGPAGTGVGSAIETMAAFDGQLVVAGIGFAEAGGVVGNGIARWNGSQWSSLEGQAGTGVVGSVDATVVYDGDLVIAGVFARAGGERVFSVARWDGSTWQALDGPLAAGVGAPPGAGVTPAASALAVFDGDLIVGGRFLDAGGLFVNHIARWDGERWWPLGPAGSGVGGGSVPGVRALAVFDGGLIVAGQFTTAGGIAANNIARWDGAAWSPLGAGVAAAVEALAVHDGALIAAGNFTQAGGQAANRIARWDGGAWTPLGAGANGLVSALVPFGGELVAAGNFTQAGGQTVNRIARWNGSAWAGLAGPSGTGVNGQVLALAEYAGELIVGGRFAEAGGLPVNQIARWNGSEWRPLVGIGGAGVGGWSAAAVHSLVVADLDGGGPEPAKLVAAGRFHLTGGVANWNIGVYGPGEPLCLLDVDRRNVDFGAVIAGWTSLPQTVRLSSIGSAPVSVSAIPEAAAPFQRTGGDCPEAPFELAPLSACTLIYQFAPSGDGPVSQVFAIGAEVDGASAAFTLRGTGVVEQRPPILTVDPDSIATTLPPGGAGSVELEVGNLGDQTLDWQLSETAAGGPPGFGQNVRAMVVWDDGSGPALYAGGDQGSGVNGIARWDGSRWSLLGAGMNGVVDSLTVYDGDLVAGGNFTRAGGVTVNRVARWNGVEWSALGMGLTGTSTARVNALAVHDGDLVAGGSFTLAGAVNVNGVARWNGSEWSPHGGGLGTQVFALAVYDGDLIAGGNFATVDGVVLNRMARWTGSNWQPLGAGVASSVLVLGVHDGDLIVGGGFSAAGGIPANGIARWNGSAWSALGAGLNGQVASLATFDGALVAGGIFTETGGAPLGRVARWNGSEWLPLGAGVNNRAAALAVYDEALFAGGQFTQADGQPVDRTARWDGSAWSALTPAAPADCTLPEWATLDPTAGSVAGAGSQPVTVGFDASGLAAGDHLANLCLASNDPGQPVRLVPLALTVAGAGAPALSFEPGSLAFGQVPVGQTSPAQTATLRNLGDGDAPALSFNDIAGSGFAVDTGGCGTTLPAGESCAVVVTFTPPFAGPIQPTLVAMTPGHPPALLSLSGTGVVVEPPLPGKLVASDGAAGDWFGREVSIDGDTVLVSADAADIDGNNNQGAAYVFVRDGDGWIEQAKLIAADGGQFNQFGISVALAGDTALIGSAANRAYVYVREQGVWAHQATLVGSDTAANDNFGIAVALDGDTAVIGARQAMVGGNMNQGAAYVFARAGGVWTEQAKLTAAEGAAFDVFGDAVSIDGDTVVAGAAFADPDGSDGQGLAYVFVRDGTAWSQQGRLQASDGGPGHNFGNAVSVSGDTVAVGARLADGNLGRAYVFTRTAGTWSQQARLSASDAPAGALFGEALTVDGDTLLVGALFADGQGATYVFDRTGAGWSERDKLVSPDGQAGAQFGNAVALDGGTAVIGAWQSTVDGTSGQGAAYVFELQGGPEPGGELAIDPEMVDFGTVPAGVVAGPATVTVANAGSGVLTVTGLETPAAPFTRGGGDCPAPPFELAPAAACSLSYSFTPTQVGEFEQVLALGSDGGPASLTLRGTGVATIPAQLVRLGGHGQSATVGTAFAEPLAVQVRDAHNNPVAGITVSFTAPAEGASAQLSATTVETDANGYAAVTATANGETGAYVVAATAVGEPATFALTNVAASADLAVALLASREHVRPGQLLDYVVTIHNLGPDASTGASVVSALSPLLDLGATSWQCLGPVASGCTASGTGELVDEGLALPAQGSVTYALRSAVPADADEDLIESMVDVGGPGDPNPDNDSALAATALVLYRDGFEAYGDGASGLEPAAVRLTARQGLALVWPEAGEALLRTVLLGESDDGHGFRIERLQVGNGQWLRLRLRASGPEGVEAGPWLPVAAGTRLHLGVEEFATDADASTHAVRLHGGTIDLTLPFDPPTASYRLRSLPELVLDALPQAD